MSNQPASSSRRAASAKAKRNPADTTVPDHKVVSIDQPAQPDAHKPRLVASDDSTQRVIFGIGRQRIAFDFTTRITHLEPGTGDAPASVVSVKKGPKDTNNQKPG